MNSGPLSSRIVFGQPIFRLTPFEHSNDIGAAELLPHFDRWRQPSEGVDNGQNADLAAVEQL
jgi:hypothetical protein